jgi:glyoxylase-like metal-dependent hydrolase (beta-lactamase superfamily II)
MTRGSWLSGGIVLAASLLGNAAQAQGPDYSKVEFRSEKLADNLFVLFGAGGNVGVLTGADGALLVDAELVELSPKLRAAVALLAAKPPRFVINTHFHFDHAGGNPALGGGGAVILAHDNVRKHLMTRQVVNVGVDIVTEPTPHEGLPVVTFADGVRLHLDDEEVVVVHVPNAHTDSDAFVYFEKANVLHTGDLFMSIGYPFVDGGNGGTLAGLIAAHERALALCNDKTRVIPGHGPLSDRATLQAYHDMLVVIRQRVADLVKKGRSLEQIKAAQPTREFDERWGKGFITPDVFLQRAHIEAMRQRKSAQ